MSELRQDRTTGRWVIIAPNRAHRPHDEAACPSQAEFGGKNQAICPFCPGNESELPEILVEIPRQEHPGWSVRIVQNRFAAVGPDMVVTSVQGAAARRAYGWHEVIIEDPAHNTDLTTMSSSQVENVVAAYRDRMRYHLDNPEVKSVILFRNYGPESGASLWHPHSQIVALDFVPTRVQASSDWGAKYFQTTSACPTCVEIENEIHARRRLIKETNNFVALVPFAAEYPCETWLLPKQHQASFQDLDRKDIGELAHLLRSSTRRLRQIYERLDYNLIVESAAKPDLTTPHVHWRISVIPNITNWGGFERGAGIPINPSSPEADADLLRASGVRGFLALSRR